MKQIYLHATEYLYNIKNNGIKISFYENLRTGSLTRADLDVKFRVYWTVVSHPTAHLLDEPLVSSNGGHSLTVCDKSLYIQCNTQLLMQGGVSLFFLVLFYFILSFLNGVSVLFQRGGGRNIFI